MGILADEWATYRANVMSPKCGPLQILETQTAFYAGATCMFHRIANEISEMPVHEAMQAYDALNEELRGYLAELKRQAQP
jgi:hypothetical protein